MTVVCEVCGREFEVRFLPDPCEGLVCPECLEGGSR